jgi:transposase
MARRNSSEQVSSSKHEQVSGPVDEPQLSAPEQYKHDSAKEAAASKPKPRLRCADRKTARLETVNLDSLLDPEHRARIVWQYVCALDLEPLLEKIGSVEHHPGHPAIDPRIALSLWIMATLDGIASARELARFCREHVAYRWICGGVSVNYHTLSSFRSEKAEEFDELLSRNVAVLLHQKLVEMTCVAQDGVRVRASAGSGSFHRRGTLERHLEEARQQVHALRRQMEENPQAATARQRQARQRAANERQQRLEQALQQLDKIEKQQTKRRTSHNPSIPGSGEEPKTKEAKPKDAKDQKKKDKPPRSSQTDPEARVMKMANGGFNPAYNLQFATDCATQLVVGVSVSNIGSDNGELGKMHDQLIDRYDKHPEQYLADGNFANQADIIRLTQQGCELYIPPMQRKGKSQRQADQPTDHDTPETLAWRQRMQTDQAKELYKQRASTSECVNAHMRNRDMQRLPVRGENKVKCVALLHALAHNVQRMHSLGIRLEPSATC